MTAGHQFSSTAGSGAAPWSTFHAGKIRSRYIIEVPAYSGSGGGVNLFHNWRKQSPSYLLCCGLGSDYLLLFPDVFKECDKTICREPDLSGKDE